MKNAVELINTIQSGVTGKLVVTKSGTRLTIAQTRNTVTFPYLSDICPIKRELIRVATPPHK
jgi:hypothetical protein